MSDNQQKTVAQDVPRSFFALATGNRGYQGPPRFFDIFVPSGT